MLSVLPLTFLTIVEQGSITAAADKLDMVKSAVSQNLKRLESQLGVKLATRTTRSFTLTPAGQSYYARCKELMSLSKMAVTEMENFGAIPSGPIVVTAPHALISPVIAPAMARIASRFENLRPQLIAEDKRLNMVAEGIDVSITVGQLADSGFKARRIGSLNDVLCAAPSLLVDRPSGDDKKPQWINSLPYIAHAREARRIKHRLTKSQTAQIMEVDISPRLISNTIESVAALARQGIGMALLPDIAVKNDLSSGRLVKVLPEYELETKPIYAVHAYDNQPPLSVLSTIEAIENVLKNCP